MQADDAVYANDESKTMKLFFERAKKKSVSLTYIRGY